jgi:SAM-dependent MidA family methyltransferase
MAATFENIYEADKVALHIRVRIFKTVAHTRLGGQMNDAVKCVIGEELLHPFPVGQVKANKTKFVKRLQDIKTRLFQPHIIVAVKIVKADDAVTVIEEPPAQVKTYETGCACDQNETRP